MAVQSYHCKQIEDFNVQSNMNLNVNTKLYKM